MAYKINKFITRGAAVLLITATLPGCLPLTTPTLIGLAFDGFSFMTTGKSVADHAISEIAQRDCSVGRAVFTGTDICFENDDLPIIALQDVPIDTPITLQPASGPEADESDVQVMSF